MPFQCQDVAVRTSDGRNFTLLEPLPFTSLALQKQFRAPVGSKTDGASTPQAAWVTLPPFGAYWMAAVLHDAAYRDNLEVFDGDKWVKAHLPKVQCDDLFKEAMDSLGVPEKQVIVIYEAVRFGGNESFVIDRLEAPL